MSVRESRRAGVAEAGSSRCRVAERCHEATSAERVACPEATALAIWSA
jgi:hypothetical protein